MRSDLFSADNLEKESAQPAEGIDPAELYEQIGRLKVELDWLKRKARWVS